MYLSEISATHHKEESWICNETEWNPADVQDKAYSEGYGNKEAATAAQTKTYLAKHGDPHDGQEERWAQHNCYRVKDDQADSLENLAEYYSGSAHPSAFTKLANSAPEA